MTVKTEVRKTIPGFNYSVFIGCDTDEDGKAKKGTAERIYKGWAPSEEEAERAMKEVFV